MGFRIQRHDVTAERGHSQITFVVFLCLSGHGGKPSVVIQPLGPVGLVVDVVGHFFQVLKVGPAQNKMKVGLGRGYDNQHQHCQC